MAGKTARDRLRAALRDARVVVAFALVDVVAIAAATVALLPLALRGRPAGARPRPLEPSRPAAVGDEAEDAARETPVGAPRG